MLNRAMLVAIVAATAVATPTLVRAQNVPQMLQGLMTGNQNQDQALREAYERGYRQGRQDEARLARRDRRSDEDRGLGNNDNRYNPEPPYRR